MSELHDNPFSAPAVTVTLPNTEPVLKVETKSPWHFVWAILFLLMGSFFTTLAFYFTFRFVITWDVAPRSDRYVLSTVFPKIFAWTAGVSWLWSARCFWLTNYRQGLIGAAIGFVSLMAVIVWLGRILMR